MDRVLANFFITAGLLTVGLAALKAILAVVFSAWIFPIILIAGTVAFLSRY